MSDLDAANAAPQASDTERKSALGWIIGALVVGAIALLVTLVFSYKSHKAEVATIVNKPVALPELVKPTIFKRIVKKIAPQAVNTPQTVDFVPEKQVSKPVNSDGFTSEFDKRLAEFERKIP